MCVNGERKEREVGERGGNEREIRVIKEGKPGKHAVIVN